MEENLPEKLKKYGKSDFYPLHMPGHKRQISYFEQPFELDITEIDGFDNLFHAEEVLLEAQQRAAGLYGAEETFYLVNGSTCGILAAVSAAVHRGGQILMARNCHKAAYHAVLLNGLHARYLYPPADMMRGINGSISVEMVRRMLEEHGGTDTCSAESDLCKNLNEDRPGQRRSDSGKSSGTNRETEAVLITSPTYDGVVSDIRGIAEVVHRAGAVLIVDEAHGAHFAMDSSFPESALACGADIVINSVHKTLPSMTQTALLHVQGPFVDRDRLKKYLGVYQSSSPSYVLMAGIDACICMMQKERGVLYGVFRQRLERLRTALEQMKVLHLVDGKESELSAYEFDRSKVLISTEKSSINGPELARILREQYHLEVEMAAQQYVTAIMTVADTEEGFERLAAALLEIDAKLDPADEKTEQLAAELPSHRSEAVLTITEADDAPQEQIPVSESAGRISAEFVYLYPPGIPILVPGERIPKGLQELMNYDREIGLSVQGLADYTGRSIQVVKEPAAE